MASFHGRIPRHISSAVFVGDKTTRQRRRKKLKMNRFICILSAKVAQPLRDEWIIGLLTLCKTYGVVKELHPFPKTRTSSRETVAVLALVAFNLAG